MSTLEEVFTAFVEHGDIHDLASARYACKRWYPEASEVDIWVAFMLIERDGNRPGEELLRRWRRGDYFIEYAEVPS